MPALLSLVSGPLLSGPLLSGSLLSGSLLSATVQLNPDAGQIPGAAALQNLANGIGGWALIASMVGVIVGAIMWAFGHYSQNYQQAYNGRRGVVVSALAAALIGGAPYIVRFMLSKGSSF